MSLSRTVLKKKSIQKQTIEISIFVFYYLFNKISNLNQLITVHYGKQLIDSSDYGFKYHHWGLQVRRDNEKANYLHSILASDFQLHDIRSTVNVTKIYTLQDSTRNW